MAQVTISGIIFSITTSKLKYLSRIRNSYKRIFSEHPISAIRRKVLEIYEAVIKDRNASWFDDEYTRISKLIKNNDQSAILYLKILWKEGKLTDAKSSN